ncbi:hypothetical protein OH799_00605 [Nocardia sp. NBC_00881]|uniref:hypothetical protein n=1 Tax=Nocardia sp. NBC_00881 TaxID=2975995 RepID=UPI0038662405|nr:hypothetical protein OH799_00605 [Nocardia sp. NBC_00881]
MRGKYKPSPPEVVTVSGGLAVISLRGGSDGSLLSIAGDPVLTDSSDFSGSLGWIVQRHIWLPGERDPHLLTEWVDEAQWQRLRTWLADPTPVERLADPLAPLLGILEDGEYSLRLCTLNDVRVFPVDFGKRHQWYRGGFGDWDVEVVPTHRWPPPNTEMIEQYCRQLADGGRPAAIVLSHSAESLSYLLDGHHKMSAYLRRGLDPVCVSIVRQPPHGVRRWELPHPWPDNRPIW